MKDGDRECGNCRFFSATRLGVGACCINPPTLCRDALAAFPTVKKEDTCGKHRGEGEATPEERTISALEQIAHQLEIIQRKG
jgi:hypothetical protein